MTLLDLTNKNFYFQVKRSRSPVRVSASGLCKKCRLAQIQRWKAANIDKVRAMNRLQKRRAYPRDKDKIAEYRRAWVKKNKGKARERARKYAAKRMAEDPLFRIKRLLRTRLYLSVRKSWKSGSSVSDLGCSIEEFKKHIEDQFSAGMTWDNWGRHGWHIDHIVPLASFDLSDRGEFLRAVHYMNLRPLWAKDNLSKGARHG